MFTCLIFVFCIYFSFLVSHTHGLDTVHARYVGARDVRARVARTCNLLDLYWTSRGRIGDGPDTRAICLNIYVCCLVCSDWMFISLV